jgi:hypothetical protein
MGRIHSQALQRAAGILGGTQELCAYLQVPAEEMRRWIDGGDAPPAGIFLRVVDLIVEASAVNEQAPSAPPSGGDRREPA